MPKGKKNLFKELARRNRLAQAMPDEAEAAFRQAQAEQMIGEPQIQDMQLGDVNIEGQPQMQIGEPVVEVPATPIDADMLAQLGQIKELQQLPEQGQLKEGESEELMALIQRMYK